MLLRGLWLLTDSNTHLCRFSRNKNNGADIAGARYGKGVSEDQIIKAFERLQS